MTTNFHLKLYATQAKMEWLKLARMPVYLIMLLCLPLFFYLTTGVSNKGPQIIEGIGRRVYQLATLGTFATFGIALFGFGVGLAIERGQGWQRTLRPAPISPWVPVAGKLLVCTGLTALATLLLLLEAALLFEVTLPMGTMLRLFVTLVGCSVPLCAIGLALGSWVGPNSAPLIAIIPYIFMSSISGIVVPMAMIQKGNPKLVEIAPIWPTYHAGQLALSALRPAPSETVPVHIAALLLVTGLALGLAWLAYHRRADASIG